MMAGDRQDYSSGDTILDEIDDLKERLQRLERALRTVGGGGGGGGLTNLVGSAASASGSFDQLELLAFQLNNGATVTGVDTYGVDGGSGLGLFEALLNTMDPVALTTVNGWSAGNSGPHGPGATVPPVYWIDLNGTVHLTGALQSSGPSNNQPFQLPVGFRPRLPSGASTVWPVRCYSSSATPKLIAGYIEIFDNGVAYLYDLNNNALDGTAYYRNVYLGHIAFRAA